MGILATARQHADQGIEGITRRGQIGCTGHGCGKCLSDFPKEKKALAAAIRIIIEQQLAKGTDTVRLHGVGIFTGQTIQCVGRK